MSSNIPLPASQTQFHPNFDREVFMVAFVVEGQGFKTDAARLCMHSEVMRLMLYGEDGQKGGLLGLPGEGTAEKPIKIEGCTAEAFANFLKWLNHDSWETPQIDDIKGYLDILHITHMWGISAGFKYAINSLNKYSMRSAYKIHLVCRYGIPEWIAVPVRVLLRLPLKDLTEDDYNHLGYDVFSKLALGKENIQAMRRKLAFFAPYPNTDDAPHCSNPERCKKAWYRAWGLDLFRLIHHPSDHLSFCDVIFTLRNMKDSNMHPECRNFVIDWVEESCPGLQKEEHVIRQVVASIQDHARIHMIVD